ncbi:hypothetical protein P7L70_06050 (plasmid) [Tistrella mobilis]|uniref:hypothetical protein n=1 Tax=Tistrella mobilis TaxID=171437 RepID=UPI003558AAC1
MDLSANSKERLDRLKSKMEASSYADIMKDALRLLEFMVDEEEKNGSVFIEYRDGEKKEVKIFI